MTADRSRSAPRWVIALISAASAAILASAVARRFSIAAVWDDAYFLVRYADNWIATGAVSWTPGGAPTWGLTAPLTLLLMVPIRLLNGDGSPALAAVTFSLLSGLFWIGTMAVLTFRSSAGRRSGFTLFALLLAVLAGAAQVVASHLLSGMDTLFSMAIVTLWLDRVQRHARSGGRTSALVAGVLGGVSFLARPDLLIFTGVAPLVLAWSEGHDTRQGWRTMALTTGMIVAVVMLAGSFYFHSPVPLPFFAKGTALYGPYIFERYRGVAFGELAAFARNFWILAAAALASLAGSRGGDERGVAASTKALLLSSALFVSYHAFLVLPVMHYDQRFYFPALPALILLAFRGLESSDLIRSPRVFVPGVSLRLLAILALGLPLSVSLFREVAAWRNDPQPRGEFDVVAWARSPAARQWDSLSEISQLPDDLVIAGTELGLPAALNPRKTLLDLSGLNDTGLARLETNVVTLLRKKRPDAIYLPNPDYREMRAAILADPTLRARYLVCGYPSPSSLGLLVDKDSPHINDLRKICIKSGS